MKKKNMLKAVVAVAIALAFVLPGSAVFANFETIGITPDIEITGGMENIVEFSTNSDTNDNSEDTEDTVNMISVVTDNNLDETVEFNPLQPRGVIYVDDDNTEGPWDGSWEHPYQYIQDGVNNANPGDTIYVFNGVYYERVTVNKQLNLIGQSRNNVIVDGGGSGTVVYVTVNEVNITNFTVRKGQFGIYIYAASNCNVLNCNAYDNSNPGIYLYYSSNINIMNCDSYNNSGYASISIDSSSNNELINCNTYNSSAPGIRIYSSSNTNITNCGVYDNSGYGIYFYKSSNNHVANCTSYNNDYGIYIERAPDNVLRDNTLHDNACNFDVSGRYVSDFYQDIDSSNTVNGKIIYYLIGGNDLEINETMNIGYLGLISCANVTVKNLDIYGSVVVDTFHSTIFNIGSHDSANGIYLRVSSENDIINCTFYNNNYGIYLYNSPNNNITNCGVYDNSGYGIYLSYSQNSTLRDNTIYDNSYNFNIGGSDTSDFYYNIGPSNTINGKSIWYLIEQSDFELNETDNFGYLGLISCNNITAKNSDICGAILVDTLATTISNVNSHNSGYGINILSSQNINITNCDFHNNNYGIWLDSSSNNFIANCSVYSNSNGFRFQSSSNNKLVNCSFYDNANDGIFNYASTNEIADCDFYNNSRSGIWVYSSSNTEITNCNIYNNKNIGVYLFSSSNNKLRNNSIYNNTYDFKVYGTSLSQYIQDIDTSNTVNEKTLCYFVEESNLEVSNFGYLGLISCDNITAKDSDIYGEIILMETSNSTILNVTSQNSDGDGIHGLNSPNTSIINYVSHDNIRYGIWLDFSENSNFENCTLYNSNYGIYLTSSPNSNLLNCVGYNNTWYGICLTSSPYGSLTNCVGYNNYYGIYVTSSSNCNLLNCVGYDNSHSGIRPWDSPYSNLTDCVSYNNRNGIYIYRSSNDRITNCTSYDNDNGFYFYKSSNNNLINCVSYNNQYGIYIGSSSDSNLVYHNNFIGNSQNAYDECTNIWDNGYPSGGNYWSDYMGVDEDGDGIGDTPYNITGGSNQDRYPLMTPLDEIPPVITDVQATPAIQTATDPVNITCTVTDNWDMIDTVKVNISGPDGFTLEEEMNEGYWYENTYTILGVYYYYIVANDTSGNIAVSDTYTFVITEFDKPMSAVDPLPQWKKTVPFTVTATAYDNTGVANVTLYYRYSSDEVNWTDWVSYGTDAVEPWSWSFTGVDGYYEFYSIAIDDYGNIEDPPSTADASTGIDTENPVTTHTLDGTMGDNGWYVSDVTVTLSANDNLSGVDSTWYQIDSGYWTLYTAPFTVSEEGEHTVYYYSFDNAGNQEDTKSVDFKIDKTPPVTAHELDGVIGEDGWFVSDVTVTLTAEDNIPFALRAPMDEETSSGVNYTMYKLDDGEWTTYTEPFNVTEDGTHTLYYYSVDLAGNTEPTNEVDFKIEHDVLPPETTHELVGVEGDNGWFVSDVTVILTAEDRSPSGVNYTMYKLDDNEWEIYEDPFVVTENGVHNLSYYSVDYIGNEEDPCNPVLFKIDQTPPTISLTVEKIGLMKWLLTATVSDETSGVARVEFYLDGELLGTVTEPPYEWEVSKKGTAHAIVYDNAGNQAISDPVPVSVSQSQSSSNPVPVQRGVSWIYRGGLTGIQNIQRRV